MATKPFNIPFLFLTILFISWILMVGCDSQSASNEQKGDNTTNKNTGSSTPRSGGTITIGIGEEPDTLDVHKTSMNIVSLITSHIGGTLLAINPNTNELEPYLAESYNVSDDGKTITFKIREGVVFEDGTPLTAKGYKKTFDRILDPETGSTVAASLVAGIASTSAPDDHTFVIELGAPSAPFLRNLASEGHLQPLSQSALEKLGDNYGRNPVGAGPWKFKEWLTGQSISFVRNDNFNWPQSYYENKGKAYPDELVYKIITDSQIMLAALDSGSIDIAMGVAAKDVKRYRNNKKFKVLESDRQGLGLFMEMNIENGILEDINVRKAINMAIDKGAIINAVLSGEGKPAYGPIPSTMFGYDTAVESYAYKFDKDGAISLLESSGWKTNNKGIREKNGKELKFELSSFDQNHQAAQMVQAMLKELGIDINIQSMESGALIEKVSRGEYELSFLAYSYMDPDILYAVFHSSQIGGLNHARVNNPELDALLEKGRITIDSEERKQIYADIQKIIVDNAYWAPIYVDKGFNIVNTRVHNVKLSNGGLLLHDSWVTE